MLVSLHMYSTLKELMNKQFILTKKCKYFTNSFNINYIFIYLYKYTILIFRAYPVYNVGVNETMHQSDQIHYNIPSTNSYYQVTNTYTNPDLFLLRHFCDSDLIIQNFSPIIIFLYFYLRT